MFEIEYNRFLDKVHGCWYGKCLGGAAGAPVEGIKKIIDVNDFSEIFDPNLPNDDLDLQLLWLDVLEKKGTIINSCDLADAWIAQCWYPFSEYGYFMKNYMRGVKPPYSGIINNSFFKEGMGCPIRSEIWGIISAGNPKLAADYAYIDATLDHADNSVYAEQLLAVIESMAFFETDIEKLILTGLSHIPMQSKLYHCITEILGKYKTVSWEEMRKEILKKYEHPDFTNVVQNLAFVMIALLYGKGDMRDTINIALKCGYDTDCTCASAASIVGIIKGYRGLGDEITGLINDYFIIGIDVERPSNSIRRLAEDTATIALRTPNDKLKITGAQENREQGKLHIEKFTQEGYNKALKSIAPFTWEIYGPYYEQLNQPIDERYPSPHGEGCVLPDLVCMVNNEVFIDKEYRSADEKPTGKVNAYEDIIPIEDIITAQGQICCYARTKIRVERDRTVWAVIGNTDGFVLSCNGEEVLKKDEIRYWTPYNNFTLLDLKQGENIIEVKLLRRTNDMKFAIGFREYDGGHWHKSKWCIDLT